MGVVGKKKRKSNRKKRKKREWKRRKRVGKEKREESRRREEVEENRKDKKNVKQNPPVSTCSIPVSHTQRTGETCHLLLSTLLFLQHPTTAVSPYLAPHAEKVGLDYISWNSSCPIWGTLVEGFHC